MALIHRIKSHIEKLTVVEIAVLHLSVLRVGEVQPCVSVAITGTLDDNSDDSYAVDIYT